MTVQWAIRCSCTKLEDPQLLRPHPRNPNEHPAEQLQLYKSIIAYQGWRRAITVSLRSGFVVKGHGALMSALEGGQMLVPVDYQEYPDEASEIADMVADNQLARLSAMNGGKLLELAVDLRQADFDLSLTGFTELALEQLEAGGSSPGDGGAAAGPKASGALAESFVAPPFSVLDARQGYWKTRKQQWLSLGIESERGRDDNLLNMSETVKLNGSGTSIFDPVLCELAYRWFCPPRGKVLDPFAGGSVRGIVAAKLGRSYTGCELRAEQVEANRAQANAIMRVGEEMPMWIAGDSRATIPHIRERFDLIMSCPPYADLEVYSDDPNDLSNMGYGEFLIAYRSIIDSALQLLKEDRFAFWVIGEVREKNDQGFYRNFVPETISAFEDAGARFYNEAILLTSIGTLPLRVGRIFTASRKLGKTHQNVLVFCKGDPRRACEALGDVELGDLEAMATEDEG